MQMRCIILSPLTELITAARVMYYIPFFCVEIAGIAKCLRDKWKCWFCAAEYMRCFTFNAKDFKLIDHLNATTVVQRVEFALV